ncbi:MAG: hypothetical protein CM1200mP14_08860 [Gammaproteobacteria bacterium]|nr:MAG: hypothetical protein CM1200mP14_08860 [Gammaproteobacteria bacterium]
MESRNSRHPTEVEMDDLSFAWAAIFSVKSNAILIARDGGVLGIGAGQMSRVDSSKIAVRKADEAGFDVTGSVLASDAFFPFRDGLMRLRKLALRRLFNRVARSGMRKLLTRLTNTDSHGLYWTQIFRH